MTEEHVKLRLCIHDPRNPEAAFRIGMLQQEAGAAKEAYESYERAIRIEPKLALAYNNLAWLAATRRERLAEALAWIQKARFSRHGYDLLRLAANGGG